MFTTSCSTSRDEAAHGAHASSLQRQFSLGEKYGEEAAVQVASILHLLADAGFAKVFSDQYSVFERVLGGICWLLERVVKREEAAHGRVQWELLFTRHDKMKPRLGLAQEVVRCVDTLPFTRPVSVQPHQLLLQDFGDIGAVKRLVAWLVELAQDAEVASHLDQVRTKKAYLSVGGHHSNLETVKREVAHLQNVYQPRRRYQYTDTSAWADESEDALIQRCLLEYGERVAVASVPHMAAAPSAITTTTTSGGTVSMDPQRALMAQLASAASAVSAARKEDAQGHRQLPPPPSSSGRRKRTTTRQSSSSRAFEMQYQRMVEQSLAEQTARLEQQRVREAQLLQQVVTVTDTGSTPLGPVDDELVQAQTRLLRDETSLISMEDTRRMLQQRREEMETQAEETENHVAALKADIAAVESEEQSNRDAAPFLSQLRELVASNEATKATKKAFKTQCKAELAQIHARIEQLRKQESSEASQQDEEALRLQEIEQMHAQMATKHKELRLALASQSRALQKRMKQIDDVPTRIELVQYEKRFLELYDEVALTLDETRKYFCVYNTLKTTHEYLEKEIALLTSIHANFDVAMGSTQATQAYFTQLDVIIQNVEVSVRKQQTLRAEHQAQVETLDSKYQLLLEKERTYVNAICEFQKECEKNEKLSAKVIQYQQHLQAQQQRTAPVIPVGVSMDDVVI